MGRPIKNLAGSMFGRLTVKAFSHINRGGNACWLALCECGGSTTVAAGELHKGSVRSCGCLRREHARSNGGLGKVRKHGEVGKPTYMTWKAMKGRCLSPADKSYRYYGARGITVCDRWRKFENFLADMGKRPVGKTLDRTNCDGNYEPGNCRWATGVEQRNNRSKKAKEIENGNANDSSANSVETADTF